MGTGVTRSSGEERPGGRYEVLERLGAGAMGAVYRGRDRLTGRTVALKRLTVPSEQARTRYTALFQREYDTLTQLTHPSIVEVYHYGIDDEGPFYTMELLSGTDLAQAEPLPWREACRLMRDVASALALLHARKLVHRDVGPRNVRRTTDGRAKLIDFGALMPFGRAKEIVGTPPFVAPECLTAVDLDQRADLYALGALTYWLLARRTHAPAQGLASLIDAVEVPLVRPSEYAPEIPAALDDLVLSLLRHDRVARPASAADVIARLTAIAELPSERDEARVAESYLRHPPLVGRESELAAFRPVLRATLAGKGGVFVVEGERGLGRSALLEHFATEAQLAGASVLRVEGVPQTTAFAAARQLVHGAFAQDPGLGPELERASGLLRLPDGAPAAKQGASRTATDASEVQAAVAAAHAEALLRAGLRSPLVLLVDDAHQLDAESLSLFASMVEPLKTHPVCLVLASLPDHAAKRDGQAWASLVADATRAVLTPLAPAQMLTLIDAMFGGVPNGASLAGWLQLQTGGNPGHALELTRRLLTDGAIRYTIGTFTLPHDLGERTAVSDYGDALLARVASVDASVEAVLVPLVLHPGALDVPQLAAATGLGARDVLLALEDLARRGVVVERSERFTCASESLRVAVARTFAVATLRAGHLALARTLAQRSDGSLEARLDVAGHLLRAGEDEAYEGALLMAQTGDEHRFEAAMMQAALPLFERALAVLEARGLPDAECVGLLVPLSLSGFYGRLEAQRRYLDRTLSALSTICGMASATRLRPVLGPTLALYVGMIAALIAHLFASRKVNRRSFAQHLEALVSITGPAVAAAASACDPRETTRITGWFEPFAAAPERSGLYVVREFCVATAELAEGATQRASARYAAVLEALRTPVPGMDDVLREQASLGCLHGQAQALVCDARPEALAMADELVRRGPFYAPHAECIRMSYHAYRGESAAAAHHRARAEALAFQGGTAWSALAVVTARSVQACVLTGDVVALVRLVADLGRLASLSASMEVLHELAEAHVLALGGQVERALSIYERVLETPVARALSYYPFERAMHAEALLQIGDYAGARQLCLPLLADEAHAARDIALLRRLPRQKLALAEAGLGNVAEAAALLDACLAADLHDDPLALGSLHRDRALAAAHAGDVSAFTRHFEEMARLFEATDNPCLTIQRDAVRAKARQLGLRCALTLEQAAASLAGLDDGLDGSTEIDALDDPDDESAPPPRAMLS